MFENYVCDGQMSIFDIMTIETPAHDFETMSIEEAARLIGEATGLSFKLNDRFEIMNNKIYIAKAKGYIVSINFNHFSPSVRNGRRYLGTQVDKGTSGCGSPCESIEEAIKWIKRSMK